VATDNIRILRKSNPLSLGLCSVLAASNIILHPIRVRSPNANQWSKPAISSVGYGDAEGIHCKPNGNYEHYESIKYAYTLPFAYKVASAVGKAFPFVSAFNFDGESSLKVAVRFFTTLREITGKREETLEFPDCEEVTVEKVLGKLAERYGKGFVEYVYDSRTGDVKEFLQFLINGRSTSTLKGLKTELRDGDILAIIPPVGGGYAL